MGKIATIMALAFISSLAMAEEAEPPVRVQKVAVPMVCGNGEYLLKMLSEGNYKKLATGNDRITEGTYVHLYYDPKDKGMIIAQWADDMSVGCFAYNVGEISFAKDIDKLLKPGSDI